MQSPGTHIFTPEIDFREIDLQGVIGKGTFGVVHKATWKGRIVAVKCITTEQEKQSFLIEVKQLSRANHPNIVKMYGACLSDHVCLVMEFAECSLYNVLHEIMPRVHYTFSNAISWCLQCAKGVAYLHSLKPKPLIHRDLKPPNLLLVNQGTIIKICDFGTACDIHTNMTNNKGSAAWMAPEVFESWTYSEKCDVYSWSIILWEVLARKKPYNEIGGPAFRIMWQVHNGQRPPLLRNCPKFIEDLMTTCWSQNFEERPSMNEVVAIMEQVFELCDQDSIQPLNYPVVSKDYYRMHDNYANNTSSSFGSQLTSMQISTEPPFLSDEKILNEPGALSVPNIAASGLRIHEPLNSHFPGFERRFSIDVSNSSNFSKSHRRTGSHDTPVISEQKESSVSHLLRSPIPLSKSRSFTDNSNILDNYNAIANMNMESFSSTDDINSNISSIPNFDAYLVLDPKLRPLQPDITCKESIELYEAHKKKSLEYFKMHLELTLLLERKFELEKILRGEEQISTNFDENFFQIQNDRDELIKFRNNLKEQLAKIKRHANPKENSDGDWVVVPNV